MFHSRVVIRILNKWKGKQVMTLRSVLLCVILLVTVALMLMLPGCNTWKGVGKDVEKTGEAMQGE